VQENLESVVEFLLRPRQRGLSLLDHWLRPTPAKMAPFITGADTYVGGFTGKEWYNGRCRDARGSSSSSIGRTGTIPRSRAHLCHSGSEVATIRLRVDASKCGSGRAKPGEV
jgi:hypothetical protein